jgi:hypothetical protein
MVQKKGLKSTSFSFTTNYWRYYHLLSGDFQCVAKNCFKAPSMTPKVFAPRDEKTVSLLQLR